MLRRSWNETLRGQISDMPAIAFLPKIFLPLAHVLDDVAQVFDGVVKQDNAVVGGCADRGRRKRRRVRGLLVQSKERNGG